MAVHLVMLCCVAQRKSKIMKCISQKKIMKCIGVVGCYMDLGRTRLPNFGLGGGGEEACPARGD
jgi:hypothetical protein